MLGMSCTFSMRHASFSIFTIQNWRYDMKKAYLLLADGTLFEGYSVGYEGRAPARLFSTPVWPAIRRS